MHEVGDDAPHVGVGDVLAAGDRGQVDRCGSLGPVQPARHGVGHARAGAATRPVGEDGPRVGRRSARAARCRRPCAAEVVVHEPAGDAGAARDVLDRDLVVGALGEQRVGRVEDLVAPLPGVRRLYLGEFIRHSIRVIGGPSRVCYHDRQQEATSPETPAAPCRAELPHHHEARHRTMQQDSTPKTRLIDRLPYKTIAAVVITGVVCTASTATAATLITSAQIKDKTIREPRHPTRDDLREPPRRGAARQARGRRRPRTVKAVASPARTAPNGQARRATVGPTATTAPRATAATRGDRGSDGRDGTQLPPGSS